MKSKNLLTKKQVAKKLNVSEKTVDRYISAGSLACVRLGRLVRIETEVVTDFITNKQTVNAENNIN